MKYWYFLFLLIWSYCKPPERASTANIDPFNYSISKTAHAKRGMVVCAHPLGAAAGIAVMKKGGNAFDAAVTTQFVLAVVYPGAGNIGGGGFMIAKKAEGDIISLDYRETAPGAVYKDMYLDSAGNVMPGKSTRGSGSSGVPGSVAGIFETIKYAKLPLKELIQPAIDLAEKGFVITEGEAASLNAIQTDLERYNRSVTAFQKDSHWQAGDTLIQKDLAETLKRIRNKGLKGFYEGETARLIVEEMEHGNGKISAGDLRNYKAQWRAPQRFKYREYEIVTMGLPSSGGILLHQMFGMLEKQRLANSKQNSPEAVQLITEIERRAYADRAQHLGDPDFIRVPVEALVSPSYLDMRMKDYQPGKAGSSDITKAGALPKESEQTTHISITDSEGNAISVTTTLNDAYGSRTVVTGAGFLLNNEMDDFSVKPGEPNLYGAIGGEANAIAPGKRMLSSMAPTIVLKNGLPFLVVGTPGGTTIPTSVFQTIVNIVDFQLSTPEAVNAPKFHHQWLPDRIDVERAFPQTVRIELEKMGYRIYERGQIGRTEVIKILPDGTFEGVADGRGEDSAEGW